MIHNGLFFEGEEDTFDQAVQRAKEISGIDEEQDFVDVKIDRVDTKTPIPFTGQEGETPVPSGSSPMPMPSAPESSAPPSSEPGPIPAPEASPVTALGPSGPPEPASPVTS